MIWVGFGLMLAAPFYVYLRMAYDTAGPMRGPQMLAALIAGGLLVSGVALNLYSVLSI